MLLYDIYFLSLLYVSTVKSFGAEKHLLWKSGKLEKLSSEKFARLQIFTIAQLVCALSAGLNNTPTDGMMRWELLLVR